MGQKVNPHGLRVGIIKDWDSRWYAKDEQVGDLIVEDYNLRKMLKKRLSAAGVPRIEIERDNAHVRIFIHCARPGLIIGKGGEDIDKLRAELEKKLDKPVVLNVVEVREPDKDAQLVAESIAQQLEKRIAFRRAMKNAMGRAMRMGALGIKVQASGRLNGAEIARTEHYHDGTIPLQTLRADIDYGFAEAATTYGRVGIKVWIYKGEILTQTLRTTPRTIDTKNFRERDQRPRRRDDRRRDGGRRDNRSGGQGGGYRQGGGRPAGQGGGRPMGQGGGGRPSGQGRPMGQGSRPAGQGSGQGGGRPMGQGSRPMGQSNRPAGQGRSSSGSRPAGTQSSRPAGAQSNHTAGQGATRPSGPKEGGSQ